MSRWILTAVALPALALASVVAAQASTTSINASPTSAAAGETVTFTATFTSSCAGTIKPHYFTIDGQHYFGSLAMSGLTGTETLSISTLASGLHTVKYYWQTTTASCIGSATMSYTVNPAAAPTASPSPAPSPSPRPSPSQTPSPSSSPGTSPSPSPVALVADKPSDTSVLGYFGGAMLIVVLVAGGALMLVSRR